MLESVYGNESYGVKIISVENIGDWHVFGVDRHWQVGGQYNTFSLWGDCSFSPSSNVSGKFASTKKIQVRSIRPNKGVILDYTYYLHLSAETVHRNWGIRLEDMENPLGELRATAFCSFGGADPRKYIGENFSEDAEVMLYWASSAQPNSIISNQLIGKATVRLDYKQGTTETAFYHITLPPVQQANYSLPDNATYVVGMIRPGRVVMDGKEMQISDSLVDNYHGFFGARIIEQIPGKMAKENWLEGERIQLRWMGGNARLAGITYRNPYDKRVSQSMDLSLDGFEVNWSWLDDKGGPIVEDQKTRERLQELGLKEGKVSKAFNLFRNSNYLKTKNARLSLGEEVRRVAGLFGENRVKLKLGDFSFRNKPPFMYDAAYLEAQSMQASMVAFKKTQKGLHFVFGTDRGDVMSVFGDFSFYAIVSGLAKKKRKPDTVQVGYRNLQIIALDEFSFQDFERTGRDDPLWAGTFESFGGDVLPVYYISNRDYKLWRNLTGRGNDMHVRINETKRLKLDGRLVYDVQY